MSTHTDRPEIIQRRQNFVDMRFQRTTYRKVRGKWRMIQGSRLVDVHGQEALLDNLLKQAWQEEKA